MGGSHPRAEPGQPQPPCRDTPGGPQSRGTPSQGTSILGNPVPGESIPGTPIPGTPIPGTLFPWPSHSARLRLPVGFQPLRPPADFWFIRVMLCGPTADPRPQQTAQSKCLHRESENRNICGFLVVNILPRTCCSSLAWSISISKNHKHENEINQYLENILVSRRRLF